MTSSTSPGNDTLRPTLPAAEGLAEWLLATEFGEQKSPEELLAAGERAYLRLRAHLAGLLGQTGFDALWARAMRLAQQKFSTGEGTTAVQAVPFRNSGLLAVVHGRNAVVIQQNLVVVFTSFIALLFTFIGQELGGRFIRQIWPDLSKDSTNSHAEGSS